MNKQISLSGLNDELAQVRTKKKEFLDRIERTIPWVKWLAIIKPCYYKGERGNKPYDMKFKKGSQRHLGYKAHVRVDKDSGLIHEVKVTSGNVHDVTVVPDLLTGEEEIV